MKKFSVKVRYFNLMNFNMIYNKMIIITIYNLKVQKKSFWFNLKIYIIKNQAKIMLIKKVIVI